MKITKQTIALLAFFTLGALSVPAPAQTTEIAPKGIYKEIDVARHNKAIEALNSENPKLKQQTVAAILNNPNYYNPPVIYALSRELLNQGKKDEAAYWFYLAQLRARYDANLCMDNSAKEGVSVLNNEYGPDINKYAFNDLGKLGQTIQKVVEFVRKNPENYDHRWLNLHGMRAVMSSLDDKKETTELSQPKAKWPAIKKKTIDDYYDGFTQALKKLRK